jgi:putative ABC transport system permease protein
MFGDLRHGFRGLVRTPGFSIVAIVTIALGIGANTAMFSVVNGVILRPLRFANPDRLVVISRTNLERGATGLTMSQPDLRDIQADSRTIATAAGYNATQMTLTGGDEATLIPAARVTNGVLEVIQAPPMLGRDILAEENVPDGPRVVVVSHAFWLERLGGDANVVGTTLELNEEAYEIVGVAPGGVDFPYGSQLWVPRYHDAESCGRDCHLLSVIALLTPDVSVDEAGVELATLAARLETTYPVENHRKGFEATPLGEVVYGNVRTGLLVLLGAVGLVLLIACANVANLLLVRGVARSGEAAVRAALGASRGRLASQFLAEAFLLAVTGGLLGVGLANVGLPLLLSLAPASLPRTDEIGLDGNVLLFTAGAVLVITLLFGLLPALRLSRVSLTQTLRGTGRGGTGTRKEDRFRSSLIAAEVALSLLLLIGTGLLLKSLTEMNKVQLGFEQEDVVTFSLNLPGSRYPEPQQQIQFYRDLQERLGALPEVQSVGLAFGSAMGRTLINTYTTLLDRPVPPPGQGEINVIRVVTPGYLETLRVPLLNGRLFQPWDNEAGQRVALVSRAFAERYYQNGDAVGKQLDVDMNMGMTESSRTIVGVVGDVRSVGLTRDPAPEVYVPYAQMSGSFMTVVARLAPGTNEGAAVLQRTVGEIDPMLPLRNVEMLEEAVSRSMGPATFYMILLGVFAAIAVSLAAVGLYGVVSYLVSRRTREMGIRLALGATGVDVARLVLLQGARPVGIGVSIGFICSYWGTRVLDSLLYNVQTRDMSILAVAVALLLGTAVFAILTPVRRASNVQPTEVLRAE